MPTKWIRVLIGVDGRPVRIFRNREWRDFPVESVVQMIKTEAVRSIREQVFERAKNPLTGLCECHNCGRIITWKTGEMHEKIFRGKGGEQSLENCEARCRECHTGSPDSAHGSRRWQTAKLNMKDTE